jgi:hypothetical protein
MADTLRPRLARLQELSKKVNAATDDAGRIVQGVESYLSDILHLGVYGSVVLEMKDDQEGGSYSEKKLVYGRLGPRFRIFVTDFVAIEGIVATDEEIPWANCSRDLKLLAFNNLPELLDALIKRLEGTLEQVKVNSETIQSLLPVKGVKP